MIVWSIFFFLAIFTFFVIIKPLTPLIILKLKFGNEAVIHYFPFIGDDFYVLTSRWLYGDVREHHRRLAKKHPNLKVYFFFFNIQSSFFPILCSNPILYSLNLNILRQFVRSITVFQGPIYSLQEIKLIFLWNDKVLNKTIGFINGAQWKLKRFQQSQYFSYQGIKERLPLLKNLCNQAFKQLEHTQDDKQDDKQDGIIVPLYDLTINLAGETIIQSFFSGIFSGVQIDGRSSALEIAGIFGDLVRNALTDPLFTLRWMLFGQNCWQILPSRRCKQINRRLNCIRELAMNEISKRIQCKMEQSRNHTQWQEKDFLDLLVNNSLDPQYPSKFETEYVLQTFIGTIFGGTDTTAHLMAAMVYSLAKYPEIQEEIYVEVMEFIKDFDQMEMEQLKSLRKVEALIHESMRFYSLALTLVPRRVDVDMWVRDVGLRRGWQVNCLTYFPMCNEKYYREVGRFDINRWLEPQENDPYTFIPFSAGPRNCIGQHLAKMEATVLIVYLVKNYRVILNDFADDAMVLNFLIQFERQDLVKILKR